MTANGDILMDLVLPICNEVSMFYSDSSRKSKALIAISLLICFVAGCSDHPNANEIAQIQKRGGEVVIDTADNSVAKVWLMQPNIVDADLQCLARLPRLREAYLSRAQITDDGAKLLAGVPLLVRLDLFDTQIDDAGLASIATLTRLKRLGLGNTKITDAGLQTLKSFPDLRELHLSDTHVTDAGMMHVAQLTHLRELDLSNTKVTAAGLERLRRLEALETLRLRGSLIDDSAVQTISAFTRLTDLDLSRTRVSREGVTTIIKALPRAHVNWAPNEDK
jgi:Leucine-rich repeat (LRR) protein